MQLKMDPSSDQLASAVSGAVPTLAMSGSAPDSPTTITIVSPAAATAESATAAAEAADTADTEESAGGGNATTALSDSNANAGGNTNGSNSVSQNRTNGSLKSTATPTGQSSTTQNISPASSSSLTTFASNQRFNQSNIASPTASMPLRILVLKDLVGAIIGRGGGTIKTITQDTHAKVDVHRKEHSTANENVIMIYGTPEACTSACKRIVQVMQDESRALNRPDEVVLKILAPNTVIGRIIGKSGATIKRIMTNTDAKISVNSANLASQYSNERTILISGSLEAMSQAESAISAKLRQCYEADIFAHIQASMASTYPIAMGPPPGLLSVPPGTTHPHLAGGPAFFMQPHPAAVAAASARLSAGSSAQSAAGGASTSGSASGSQPSGSVLGSSVAAAVAAAAAAGAPPGGPAGFYAPFAMHPSAGGYFPNSYPSSSFYGFGLPPMGAPQALPSGASPAQSVIVPGGATLSSTGVPHHHAGQLHQQHSQQRLLDESRAEGGREVVSLFIPNTVVGAIIGRGGQTIREMMAQSNANIKVAPVSDDDTSPVSSLSSPPPASPDSTSGLGELRPIERRVVIVGTSSAQYYAQNMIFYHVVCELMNQQQQLQQASGAASKSSQATNGFYGDKSFLRVEIYVPNTAVRRIIGRHGAVIQELQRATGTTIKLAKERPSTSAVAGTAATSDTSSSAAPSPASEAEESTAVHIIGDFMACYMAQRHIRNIVAQASLNPATYPTQATPTAAAATTGRHHDSSASSNVKTAKQSESPSDNTNTSTSKHIQKD